MDKYIPKIGDVVLDNGMPVVVVTMVSYEDAGSCGYARKYLLCDEEYIKENQGIVTIKDIEQIGMMNVVLNMRMILMMRIVMTAQH